MEHAPKDREFGRARHLSERQNVREAATNLFSVTCASSTPSISISSSPSEFLLRDLARAIMDRLERCREKLIVTAHLTYG